MTDVLKLNLGSDCVYVEGYCSVDISPKCQPDILADVVRLPLPDECVDEIWASHILEHVPYGRDALAEWKRVMKPGALITVAIPDFLEGYRLYREGQWDVRYFNATIFGAQQLGWREEFTHQQVFSEEMLVERMREHFPDAQPTRFGVVRDAFPGEAMVFAHKA